jgi:arylsulfatase A-like enzyme
MSILLLKKSNLSENAPINYLSVKSFSLINSGTILSSYATAAVSPQTQHPNVILIMTDQQFAEAMSCRMGDKYLKTPALDYLSGNGIIFTRAYSPNPLSMPARASLITGRYPHETGVTWNIVPEGFDNKELPGMGTYFIEAGYETAYYGKWHLPYNRKLVASHGFENLEQQGDVNTISMSPDTRAADDAVKFIMRSHDKPFMMLVSFLNPHNVCELARRLAGIKQVLNCGEIGDPPAPDKLPPAPLNMAPPANEPDGLSNFRKLMQLEGGVFPVAGFTIEDWQKLRWGYYRMIELVDREIGKVLQAVTTAGLADKTVIVFTSDHGECAGAHSFNQKTVFYEESVRVPLIISMKGKTKKTTADNLVNTGIDILPTILECAGISKPSGLPGKSLWPIVLGMTAAGWPEYIVIENDLRAWEQPDTPRMEGRTVITERYKYSIYDKGFQRESLYDLKSDPGEMVNIATEKEFGKILSQHRKILADFGQKNKDPLARQLLKNNEAQVPFAK